MSDLPPPEADAIEAEGGWVIVTFSGALSQIGEQQIPQAKANLEAGLERAEEHVPPKLLLDLTEVGFFGSSFIEVMYRGWKAMTAAEGQFAIVACSEHCREVLTVTRLDQLWSIYDDRASALAADG